MTKQEYKDMLDDTHPKIIVAGIEFTAGDILERLDPIAFNCGYNDYCSFCEE